MRKLTVLSAVITLSLFVIILPAFAAPTHRATFVVGQASFTVDGQFRQMDAKTFIENGRTYVPVRYLAYALGVEDKNIVWNSKENRVSLTLPEKETNIIGDRTVVVGYEITVQLQIGKDRLVSNKLELNNRRMDVTPVVRDGRTYLPARWVAEAFGYKLDWLPESQTVLVHPPGEEQPATN